MEEFPLIEMPELLENILDNESFNNDFMVADIGSNAIGGKELRYQNIAPVRINTLTVLMLQEGTAEIKIDYISYNVRPNTIVIIMPTHIIQPVSGSHDMKGRMIVVSRNFMHSLFSGDKPSSMIRYMEMKKNPCTEIDADEMVHLDGYVLMMKKKLRLRTHFFQREVIQTSFISFLLEMGNIYAGKKELQPSTSLSRKEELFEQFLRLLNKHCREEHSVSFYANELCITPQYLSLILKSQSGKSANKWIEEALMMEAKMLLRKPNTNIQQVADKLNFPDQSTFGKFFKKNEGISPSEYRKNKRF